VDRHGKKIVRLNRAAIMPVFFRHSRWREPGHARLVPVLETARAISAGNVPEHLSAADARMILRLSREYLRYFKQEGFSYR
jgi:hypothetical protein